MAGIRLRAEIAGVGGCASAELSLAAPFFAACRFANKSKQGGKAGPDRGSGKSWAHGRRTGVGQAVTAPRSVLGVFYVFLGVDVYIKLGLI